MRRIFKLLQVIPLVSVVFTKDREIPVCNIADLEEGTMKEVHIGRKTLLLAKVKGDVYCISAKCPHRGAMLSRGFLDGYNIVCPWHGAEFDIRNGALTNYPGFYPVQSYGTSQINGKIVVKLKKNSELINKISVPDDRTFVIIGAGAAGVSAAQSLRREGFSGKIIMISNEQTLPYDRVLLSKILGLGLTDLELAPESYYSSNNIELILGENIIKVTDNSVVSDKGKIYSFDKLLLATGASPKIQSEFLQYIHLPNVIMLRNFKDYEKYNISLIGASKVSIIGNRFLGYECAASIKKSSPDIQVTFIEYEPAALSKVIGPLIYSQISKSYEANGVEIISNKRIDGLNQENGRINKVVLNDREIETDLLIISTGSVLQTPYLKNSLKNSDNSVRVNEYLETGMKNVFAAGDIAEFPSTLTMNRERIEHWTVAQQQGRCASLNMLEKATKFEQIPYYWSEQFDHLEMAGYSNGHTNKIDEEISENEKVTLFFKGEELIGVAAINSPLTVIKIKIGIAKGLMPKYSEIKENGLKVSDLIKLVKLCVNCES